MSLGTAEILKTLRDKGPLSRADLVRATGLSSAGVTKLTAQMIVDGVLRQSRAVEEKSIGRPPVTLDVQRQSRFVLGIHLGAGRMSVALSDVGLALRCPRHLSYDLSEDLETLVDRVSRLAEEVIDASGVYRLDILGVGLGVPGSVDPNRRVNVRSILTGWQDVAFADVFERKLGLPVIVEHNATAMAVAEALHGAGRDAESILYLLLGKGIGAGFAQTGAGARCGAVEIGHIVVEPGGRPCLCGGQGCLERFFSEEPLRKMSGEKGDDHSQMIDAAMQSPDWSATYAYLLQALSTTVTLMAPERIVLGGFLNAAPDRFVASLKRDLAPRVMPQQRERLRIERSSLSEPVGVQGAATIALEEFFYNGASTARSGRLQAMKRA
ncbi:ROK family protein [Pseudooceanicola batsensis HTCC2597]|uniref:ROK family protein n=1 Tax=Pseudooceanicola batsensis (strain ATCC BAA-863 / DSM 15984 / KCTC 12145 / HTCC2597) TaxID=252305 RepID=A3TZT8_PSEBH|nr:ROK family protein [Pseudooceanicola batsensis]EAQ02569.1 ROK family protein [Pseudooceanicola batsensis HTCC2597]